MTNALCPNFEWSAAIIRQFDCSKWEECGWDQPAPQLSALEIEIGDVETFADIECWCEPHRDVIFFTLKRACSAYRFKNIGVPGTSKHRGNGECRGTNSGHFGYTKTCRAVCRHGRGDSVFGQALVYKK